MLSLLQRAKLQHLKEKNKKVGKIFGSMKENAYFCRRFDKQKHFKHDKNSKFLVVAQLKIRTIVRR